MASCRIYDLSINRKDVESLCIELLFENKRNTLINVLYRPPNGQTESFEKLLKNVFSITKNSNKVHHIAGDFNLNLLDHENSRKVQDSLKLVSTIFHYFWKTNVYLR